MRLHRLLLHRLLLVRMHRLLLLLHGLLLILRHRRTHRLLHRLLLLHRRLLVLRHRRPHRLLCRHHCTAPKHVLSVDTAIAVRLSYRPRARNDSEPVEADSDPFVTHIVVVIAVYEYVYLLTAEQ